MDGRTYEAWFRQGEAPKDLGVIDLQVFTKDVASEYVNKPMLSRASGNVIPLVSQNNGRLMWSLGTTGVPWARIVDVDPGLGPQPGIGRQPFRIALDVGFYHEPVILKTESTTMPRMRILGYPERDPSSANKFWYTVVLQTGSDTDWIDPSYLQIGRKVCDSSTSVGMELNEKYGGIQFGMTSDYSSQISYFARKFEFTDKAIRDELDAMKQGAEFPGVRTNGGTYLRSIVGKGFLIAPSGASKESIIESGRFITMVEYLLRDRLSMDKEYDAWFGKVETGNDDEVDSMRLNAPGWYEVSREGNFVQHDGTNLTLEDFVTRIQALKAVASYPKGDVVEIDTGTDGLVLVNQLLHDEFQNTPIVFGDIKGYFVDKAPSNFTDFGLAIGHQFVELRSFGRVLRWVYNPNKDRADLYPELNADTGLPLESSSFDVFDLRQVDATGSLGNGRNVAYAYEPGAETYFTVSNVYDFRTGSIKDGSSVAVPSKFAGVYMETNGGLVVLDVSATMRFERI
ncbi:MAG: hypothetical protein KatS3mg054_0052 [Chloroflexus sp.]|nr:MAG: hypothetical protein KatS3mg054_0052 [Chloroflexus sp.]